MSGFLGMSDEDFLKTAPPTQEQVQESQAATSTTTETPVVETETTATTTEPTVTPPVEGTGSDEDTLKTTPPVEEPAAVDKPTDTPKPPTIDPTTLPAPVADKPKVEGEVADKAKETPEEPKPQAVNYEDFYKKIMTPFIANGKMIELKDPAEAIQLMQMGANYTRKMQDMVPHRKALMMLETNGLLDESKLSYLIDLDKKNPDAIKKLVKDAGIDPMDIDTAAEPAYREGNHRVTDDEVAFHTVLDNLKSSDVGKETIRIISNNWDQASKDALWKSPDVMEIIHNQRDIGMYDRIATEVDRQKTLGKIGPDVPFLTAYKAVGEAMAQANAFADLVPKSAPPAAPVPVATRVAAPKPVTTNNDAAAAASSTRTTPKTAQTVINPLSMSDEDFLKHMANRV